MIHVRVEDINKFNEVMEEYKDKWDILKEILKNKAIKAAVNLNGQYCEPRSFLEIIRFKKPIPCSDDDVWMHWLRDDTFFEYGKFSKNPSVCVSKKLIEAIKDRNFKALGLHGFSNEQLALLNKASVYVYGSDGLFFYPRVNEFYSFTKHINTIPPLANVVEITKKEYEVMAEIVVGMPPRIAAIEECITLFQ